MSLQGCGIALALMLGLALCPALPAGAEGEGDEDSQPTDGSIVGFITTQIPVYGVSAGDVEARPERFAGQVLSVPGEVERVLSPHAFTLREANSAGGPQIVVISRLPADSLANGQAVQVVGQLRPLVLDDFEREYEWFDAAWLAGARRDLELRPTLVAASVVAVEGQRELLRGLQPD